MWQRQIERLTAASSLPESAANRIGVVMSEQAAAPSLDDAVREVALANRILYSQGVLDAFGHVSMRHPQRPDRFLISRNRAPALVRPEEIQVLDLLGDRAGEGDAPLYLERFIHAACYEADPRVQAVVHSHSSAVVPFAATRGSRLRAVCHMSGFLGSGVPLFEIRDHVGNDSNLLITDMALGRALETCRAGAAVVLMRGHGYTVAGESLREAVFRSVYTEKSARIQQEAERMGECEYLTDGEASSAEAANKGQIVRAWDFWCWQLKEQHLEL
jgi:ribulose-5-phosphate 4-epimerase/fuculose-1-phosphate aldolase